jgi:hypothetical protein
VINANEYALNTTESDALYIKPIRYGQDTVAEEENVSNVLSYDPSTGEVIHKYPQSTFLLAKAKNGDTISKGDAVYIVDAVNENVANVGLANASDSTRMPCVGIAFEDFTSGGVHPVVTFGRAKGINTSAFEEGETLYVDTSPGGLTNVIPTGNTFTANPDLIQNIGFVVKSANNGTIKVTGVGRTNDIPNANVLSDDSTVKYVYVNTSGNDLKKIDPAKLVTGPLTLSVSGRDMFPENNVNTTTITGITGSSRYAGGVLAPNGKIYGVPYNANNVLIIDPVTDTTTTITGITGTIKYAGGVLAPNGKIYGVPYNASNVLIIDTETNSVDTTTITGISGTNKYAGGVLAPNGKIYGVPYNASNVLIIDPVTNSADTVTISGLSTGTDKYIGGVLAPNGKIYCVPRDATNVLIIDPETNSTDTATISGITGVNKYIGGVLAPNGKIYGVPFGANNVLIIDPETNSSDTATITGITGSNRYVGGVLAPNGKIYCVPYDSSDVLIIDPVTDTTTTITGLSTETDKYYGGVLAPNGKIYCVPHNASNVAIIKTGVPTEGRGFYSQNLINYNSNNNDSAINVLRWQTPPGACREPGRGHGQRESGHRHYKSYSKITRW